MLPWPEPAKGWNSSMRNQIAPATAASAISAMIRVA
jgi:hypothetical protein